MVSHEYERILDHPMTSHNPIMYHPCPPASFARYRPGHHRYIPPSSREHALRLAMAGKKGKSRRRKAKHGTPASPAASTQAAARGFKPSQLEGPFPDHNGDPPGSGVAADRFADGSYLPFTVPSSRPGSQVSRVTGGDNPSPAQHQAGTALVAIGGDFRHANGSGGCEADWRRRPSGDRDTGGDRDRPAGDHCHNGESLSGSPYLRQSAARQWSWLGYSAKQFRSFAQECPPALDVGADQVIPHLHLSMHGTTVVLDRILL